MLIIHWEKSQSRAKKSFKCKIFTFAFFYTQIGDAYARYTGVVFLGVEKILIYTYKNTIKYLRAICNVGLAFENLREAL